MSTELLGRRRPLVLRTAWGTVAAVGFILSPLSWWNDAFVNIPLALAMASLVNRFLEVGFTPAFIASYWLTNMLGLILLFMGAGGAYRGRVGRRETVLSIVGSLVYTLLAVLVSRTLFY